MEIFSYEVQAWDRVILGRQPACMNSPVWTYEVIPNWFWSPDKLQPKKAPVSAAVRRGRDALRSSTGFFARTNSWYFTRRIYSHCTSLSEIFDVFGPLYSTVVSNSECHRRSLVRSPSRVGSNSALQMDFFKTNLGAELRCTQNQDKTTPTCS